MKKLICLILTLVLVLSALPFAVSATTSKNAIYFDANTTDWTDYTRIYCHIWEVDGESFYAWQARAERCTDEDGDGIWEYDLDAKNITLKDDTTYGVCFSEDNNKTSYYLLFDATVVGDTAYCVEERLMDPYDSSCSYDKPIAYWRGQNPNVFGPEKIVSCEGTVIGTCIPPYATDKKLLVDFLSSHRLDDSRINTGKDDQTLIDDIALELKLTADEVEAAIAESGASVDWSKDKSALNGSQPITPTTPVLPQGGSVITFDANTTDWTGYSQVYCHIYDFEGNSFYAWNQRATKCTDNGDGTWSYDLEDKNIVLEDNKTYFCVFHTDLGHKIHQLALDKSAFGHTAYCEEKLYENPDDYDKIIQLAYWDNIDADVLGPEMAINWSGDIMGTFIPKETSSQALFENFLKEGKLYIAADRSDRTQQEVIDDIANELGLTIDEVKKAINNSGIYTDWSENKSTIGQPSYIIGDVDDDSSITILDASLIQRAIAKYITLTDEEYIRANVDFDEQLSIIDASTIQRYIAQYITEF